MKKVVILGGTGMLGHMLVRVFQGIPNVKVYATFRNRSTPKMREQIGPDVDWALYQGGELRPSLRGGGLGMGDWIVNAIGSIPQRSPSVRSMIDTNAVLPHRLSEYVKRGVKVVHATTDCVFSGWSGGYRESSPHDASSPYGMSKSLGEVDEIGWLNLRCSIVGPELPVGTTRVSLMEWVRSHDPGETIPGYSSHLWNGVTTLAWAKIVRGMIEVNKTLPVDGTQHLVPAHPVSKRALCAAIVKAYGMDCKVESVDKGPVRDMTLATERPRVNEQLWSLGGYDGPQGIEAMIEELAEFEAKHESSASPAR